MRTNTNIPLLVYDDECKFCRYWVARWHHLTGNLVRYAPSYQVASQFPEIPPEQFETAVQFIEPGGEVFSGAEAVFRTLTHAPRMGWLLWMYQRIPGFSSSTEWIYRFIAEHRGIFSVLTRWLWGENRGRPEYYLTRWLFLRLLGATYLIAFISLWTQIDGLVGSNGILPAQEYLESVRTQVGHERYRLLPTLCWLNSSDGFLHILCACGTLLSVLLIIGVAPIYSLIGLWAIYLSLTAIGQNFLSFQWDVLLLETGFLAIFFAPSQILPKFSRESPPSRTVLWLLRWLLFRLMFASGVVKLVSADETWRNLTALNFHYETQPLPTWISWYVHQLPDWFQTISVVGMFAIELGVPFLIFAPRRLRFVACAAFLVLQLLIIATGNYCFFNLLTIVLCILLLDDTFLQGFRLKQMFSRFNAPEAVTMSSHYRSVWVAVLTVVVLLVSGIRMAGMFLRGANMPAPAQHILNWASPFRTINSYGLFAVMTTSRPEIVVEGSNDRQTWVEYPFNWKPGDLRQRPRWAAPHQPRLDWQMWFAALGSYRTNRWFMEFIERLLQGSPEVLGLLEENPFSRAPPRYIRAVLYDYHFTDFDTKQAEGTWWRRERKGLYLPEVSLRAG